MRTLSPPRSLRAIKIYGQRSAMFRVLTINKNGRGSKSDCWTSNVLCDRQKFDRVKQKTSVPNMEAGDTIEPC